MSRLLDREGVVAELDTELPDPLFVDVDQHDMVTGLDQTPSGL
jgi:hypothetical protein